MRKVIVFLFIIGFISIYAQDEGVLLSKYWNYRYALNGDQVAPSFSRWEPGFVNAGYGAGQSIPMRYRLRIQAPDPNNPWAGGPINNWEINSHLPFNRQASFDANFIGNNPFYLPAIQDRMVHGIMNWVDAPTDMGKYMIMLSTELGLLYNEAEKYNTNNIYDISNQNYSLYSQIFKTYYELNWAVSAFDRLDGASDIPYGGSFGSGDGFFIRDDVPQIFADDGKFGQTQLLDQQYWTNTNSINFRGNSFLNIQSQYQKWEINAPDISSNKVSPFITIPHPLCGLAMSKDQLAKIMIGIVYARIFAKQFETKYGNFVSSSGGINKKAFDIIDRTIWRLFPDFSIIDPDGNQVCLGSDASVYSLQYLEIFNKFASANLNVPATLFAGTVGSLSLGIQKFFYTIEYPFTQLTNTGFTGANHSHEIFAYMCAMNNNETMFLIPNSLKKMGDVLVDHNDDELEYTINSLWEPIRDRIYGGGLSMSIGTSGFSFSLPTWMPISEYESFMMRWNFQDCRHDTRVYSGNPHTNHLEEKNGLDYMIAFNLYMLKKDRTYKIDVSNNQIARYIPLFRRTVEGTFPRSNTIPVLSISSSWPIKYSITNCTYTYGTNQTPAVIQAAEYIDATTCHFEPNSRAIIRAPHIDLSPGFDARYGTVCDVFNERMECNSYTQIIGIGNCPNGELKMASNIPEVILEKTKSVSIYPNPAENNTTIKLTNYDKTNVSVVVYNMIGREMHRFSNIEITDDEQNYNMNLESLSTGIYIVKVEQGDYNTSLKLEKR